MKPFRLGPMSQLPSRGPMERYSMLRLVFARYFFPRLKNADLTVPFCLYVILKGSIISSYYRDMPDCSETPIVTGTSGLRGIIHMSHVPSTGALVVAQVGVYKKSVWDFYFHAFIFLVAASNDVAVCNWRPRRLPCNTPALWTTVTTPSALWCIKYHVLLGTFFISGC